MSGIIKHQHKRFDDVHVRGASDSGILEHQHKGKRFDNLPLLSIGYIQPRAPHRGLTEAHAGRE